MEAKDECANCGTGFGRKARRIRIQPVKGIAPVAVTEALCFACGGDYDHEERWLIKQLDAVLRGKPR